MKKTPFDTNQSSRFDFSNLLDDEKGELLKCQDNDSAYKLLHKNSQGETNIDKYRFISQYLDENVFSQQNGSKFLMKPKPDDFNIRKFCLIFIALADNGRDIQYFNSAFKNMNINLSTCNDLEIMVIIITAVN